MAWSISRRKLLTSLAITSATPLLTSLSSAQDIPSSLNAFQPIEPAIAVPNFPVRTSTGTEIDAQQAITSTTLLNVWATWCPPCVKELPSLQRMAKLAAGRFSVTLVNQDKGGAVVAKRYLQKIGLAELESFYDPPGRAFKLLSLRGLPTTFFIDSKGLIVGRFEGDKEFLADADKSRIDISPTSGEEVQKLVAQVLAAKPAVVQRAKAITAE